MQIKYKHFSEHDLYTLEINMSSSIYLPENNICNMFDKVKHLWLILLPYNGAVYVFILSF